MGSLPPPCQEIFDEGVILKLMQLCPKMAAWIVIGLGWAVSCSSQTQGTTGLLVQNCMAYVLIHNTGPSDKIWPSFLFHACPLGTMPAALSSPPDMAIQVAAPVVGKLAEIAREASALVAPRATGHTSYGTLEVLVKNETENVLVYRFPPAAAESVVFGIRSALSGLSAREEEALRALEIRLSGIAARTK